MSYILSALKKAEQQRGGDQGGLRGAISVPDSRNNQRRELPGSKAAWAVAMAALGVAAWAFYSLDSGVPTPPATGVSARLEAVTAAVPEVEPVVAQAVPAPTLKPPALNITGYIFVESKPESSKLFVDGIVYRRGSSPAPGMVIREFRPDVIVIDYRGSSHAIPVE